mgnify:CR=1 FL=1
MEMPILENLTAFLGKAIIKAEKSWICKQLRLKMMYMWIFD